MSSTSLWLPGFEVADLLFSSPTSLPSPTLPIETPQTQETGYRLAEAPESTSIEVGSEVDDSDDVLQYVVVGGGAKTQAVSDSPVWPQLTAESHRGLSGQVTKFDANLEAILLLQALEASGQKPNLLQREILNRYTGWGGIKQPFDRFPDSNWIGRAVELKDLLSEEEFESAKDSTMDAHFTPIQIVDAVWNIVQQSGFTGGRILDPSGGTGYFIGAMPTPIVEKSAITAVEIDNLSARFLQSLYSDRATVLHTAFEKANLPDEYFDLVISNIPFGDRRVGDLRRKAYSNFSIHNYFIARAIDLVRPGGLVAVVTSAFFMDSVSPRVRAHIAHKAKLLGAIRLPVGTFADIASTDVVTDIVLLQKREATEILTPHESAEFLGTSNLRDDEGNFMLGGSPRKPHQVNDYWHKHPENVIGGWASSHYSRGPVLVPKLPEGEELGPHLTRVVSKFPVGQYRPAAAERREISLTATADKSVLPGSFVIDGDVICTWDGFEALPIKNGKGKKAERIVGLIGIRETVRALIREQSKPKASEKEMASLRYALNVKYDAFIAKFGFITSTGNRLAMARDPSWPLLLSLEFFDQEKQVATKADIFFERTVFASEMPQSAETETDALAICIAEVGSINAEIIGRLLGRDGEQVLESLAATCHIFIDPSSGEYVTAREYLSGNVREKLRLARTMGISFDRNVNALLTALPKDLKPSQIDVVPGAVWIPVSDTSAFVADLFADDWKSCHWARANVTLEEATGTWEVKVDSPSQTTATQRWGTTRMTVDALFQDCLNQVDSTVSDHVGDGVYVINAHETATARMKQDELRAEYQRWIWQDDERADRLCKHYNETFNCWAVGKHDGSRLRLPGYSRSLDLREHQLNAIAQIITGWNTLLAHVVGAGKTLTMVCGSMELRRLKIAKKPWHVVQNATLSQYCAEFLRAYPTANVLMATKADFDKDRRSEFAARCATGNWDAVVITQSMFERISADPEVASEYITRALDDLKVVLEQDALSRFAERAVKKQIKDWEAKLEKMEAAWKKDALITLGSTGCDWLLVDECHFAKNLYRISRMKAIAGLNNSNSQRSFDLLLKCHQIMRLHGGKERGLTFASGTVVSNSLAELHVFQRFLQPVTLASMGLDKFDNWAAQFGRAVNSMEVAPDGSSFRLNKRFKLFVNLPELMGIYRQVADIQTREMLNLPVPPKVTGKHQVCAVEASPAVKAYVAELVERAENIRKRVVKPHEDNMLAITGDGQKVALDYRFIDRSAPYDPNSKLGACVSNVHRIWEMTKSFKGTQIIFSDMGTPDGNSFNVYADIRTRLVALGIPQSEIAFIHDAKTEVARALLFAKLRAGVVRILIGSTATCGTGTNVQTILYAVHHLTTPWRPSDIEQRDGRIERQGNTCEAIEIWRYVTQGSFDAYMWQTLTAKAGFIAQVFSGDSEVRTVEDAMMSALSYDEVKAIACGNPAVREKATLDAEIMGLQLKRKLHMDLSWDSRRQLQEIPELIKLKEHGAKHYALWYEALKAGTEHGLEFVVNGRKFTDKEKIQQILTLAIAECTESNAPGTRHATRIRERDLGALCGTKISFRSEALVPGDFGIYASYEGESIKLGSYSTGASVVKKVQELLEQLPEKVSKCASAAAYWRDQEPILLARAGGDFPEEAVLLAKIARSKEIAIEMGLLKAMVGTEAVDENSEVKSALVSSVLETTSVEDGQDPLDQDEGCEETLATLS